MHTGFWGEPGYTCHANHDIDDFHIEPLDDQAPSAIVLGADEVICRLDLAVRMMKHCVSIWTAPASRRLLRHAQMNDFVVRRGDGGRGANPVD